MRWLLVWIRLAQGRDRQLCEALPVIQPKVWHPAHLKVSLCALIGVLVCGVVGCVSSTSSTKGATAPSGTTNRTLITGVRQGTDGRMVHVAANRVAARPVPVPAPIRRPAAPAPKKAPATYQLKDLLVLALKRSPAMREAQYRLLSMKARQAEAFWTSWWPQGTLISIVAPAPPSRGNAVNTSTPQPEAFSRLAEYGVLTRVEFNLVWPLFTFGKLSLLQDAAKAGVKVGESNVALEKSKWELLVKQVYYGLQFAESSLLLLDEVEEYVDEAKKKVKGKTDKLKIVVLEAEVQARRVQAETGKKLAVSTLTRLVGLPATPKLAQAELQDPEIKVKTLAQYQALAKLHRPEIRLLDHAIQAKRALMNIEQRMWLPDLFIAAFFRYGYSSAADDQVSPFARDDFNFLESGVMLGLRFTFDVPMKLARARRAEADFGAFQSRRNLATHGIQLQIEQRFRELEAARKLTVIQKKGRKAADTWLTRSMISFSSGLVDVKEVSDALQASARLRFAYLQAVHQSWIAASQLSRAVGIDITVSPKKK